MFDHDTNKPAVPHAHFSGNIMPYELLCVC